MKDVQKEHVQLHHSYNLQEKPMDVRRVPTYPSDRLVHARLCSAATSWFRPLGVYVSLLTYTCHTCLETFKEPWSLVHR